MVLISGWANSILLNDYYYASKELLSLLRLKTSNPSGFYSNTLSKSSKSSFENSSNETFYY